MHNFMDTFWKFEIYTILPSFFFFKKGISPLKLQISSYLPPISMMMNFSKKKDNKVWDEFLNFVIIIDK